MTVLAIDTAFSACQVGLFDDEAFRLLACHSRAMERGHAEVLPVLVRDVMARAGLAFAELSLIAVTVGPGSFTGVRVGVAAARGLALVAGCPVAGLTTLEILARAVPERLRRDNDDVLAVISARRGQVYAQRFRLGPGPIACGPPLVCALEALADHGPGRIADCRWAVGDMAVAAVACGLAGQVVECSDLPDLADMAVLALQGQGAGELAAALPLYVRGPGAKPVRAHDAV